MFMVLRGRFEVVNGPLVIAAINAHWLDGLENVLKSAREITGWRKLICLFGRGDRDATNVQKCKCYCSKTFRQNCYHKAINPSPEDPQQIITDIIAGLQSVNPEIVTVEPDRGEAIVLLKSIAGK